MSRLRPELSTTTGPVTVSNGTAYLCVLNAVRSRPGLIHGRLTSWGEYCAIGSYFHVEPNAVLPSVLIDEIAAVNDSLPTATSRQRKQVVVRWLRWKLTSLGMPGYASRKRVSK